MTFYDIVNQQTFDIHGELQKDTMVLDSQSWVVEILDDYCKRKATSQMQKAINSQGTRLLKKMYAEI